MSDLSLQSGPRRTLIRSLSPIAALPVHPEAAISWHSGFRVGAPCSTYGRSTKMRYWSRALPHPRQKIFARVGNPTQGQRVQSSGEEGAIWLELVAISWLSIGFSVLALEVEL